MNAMLECSDRDLAVARTLYDQIRKLLKAHEHGERNDAMLQDMKVICICIMHAIRDPYCQEKMCEVAIHSEELFASGQRVPSERSTQASPTFLRPLILQSLEAFDDRLTTLETTQSYHGASGTNAVRSLQPPQLRIRRTPTLPVAPAATS